MPFSHVSLPDLPSSIGRLTAIHPVKGGSQGSITLLALNTQAELWRLELRSGSAELCICICIPDFNPMQPVQMVTSPDGKYVAISNRFGRHAAVYDLVYAQEKMQLSRDEYHYDKSMFPLAFVHQDGMCILVHGTEWNRLDLTDIETGRLLTARPSPVYNNESKDEHYLDYFHGRLLASPEGKWMADTGWVWAPLGVVRTWSLSDWLLNPWESENGPSVRHLWQTIDWDGPVCWTGPDTLAVWGQMDADLLEEEDWGEEGVEPAVVLFDMTQPGYRRVLSAIPPLNCKPDEYGIYPYPQADMTACGDRLFLWGKEVPLQVWRLSSGVREYIDTERFPLIYHQEAGIFIELNPDSGCTALSYDE
ncbi:hypothetical protein MMB75_01450 [Paenibacillus sp. P2(2022)]|uniref:hypothetical protein n=1 Tax=Paenibacillus TaxID=44249 RepID=UPI00211D1FB5|nr:MULTISPECIES: hypothetical protein [Paenibacillus]MDG0052329.1 hypothetical protein [Paenibacillus sp. P2(2022)]